MIFSTLALHPQGVYLASLSINNRDRSPGLRSVYRLWVNKSNTGNAASITIKTFFLNQQHKIITGQVLFNDALNTFYLRLYGIRHMVKDHSDSERGNPLRLMGYSFRLASRVLLYASSHRQDNTYHGFCYTSCKAITGTRNSSMGQP